MAAALGMLLAAAASGSAVPARTVGWRSGTRLRPPLHAELVVAASGAPRWSGSLLVAPHGDRWLLLPERYQSERKAELRDGRSGRLIAPLPLTEGRAEFAPDGRSLLIDASGGRRLYD